jgi:hypothetical protein
MNDDQLMTAVRDSFANVRLDVPVEETARRGRTLRGRSRAFRAAALAGVAGVAAIAGVTAVAVTGPGRAAPPAASASFGATGAPVVTGPGGIRLVAWTVSKGKGGAVNVTIRQLLDVAGLQRALRADGVPARVVFQSGPIDDSPPLPASCADVKMSDVANAALQAKILGWPSSIQPDQAHGIALTLYTRQIPRGIGVYLAVQGQSSPHGSWGWGLDLVQASRACTG